MVTTPIPSPSTSKRMWWAVMAVSSFHGEIFKRSSRPRLKSARAVLTRLGQSPFERRSSEHAAWNGDDPRPGGGAARVRRGRALKASMPTPSTAPWAVTLDCPASPDGARRPFPMCSRPRSPATWMHGGEHGQEGQPGWTWRSTARSPPTARPISRLTASPARPEYNVQGRRQGRPPTAIPSPPIASPPSTARAVGPRTGVCTFTFERP